NRNYRQNNSLVLLCPEQEQNGYGFSQFQGDVKAQLESKGHIYTETIAVNILIFFQLLREKELRLNSQQLWMQMMAKGFTSCDVLIDYPMNLILEENFETIKLKSIEIGRFQAERLRNEIENNTQSDYFKR